MKTTKHFNQIRLQNRDFGLTATKQGYDLIRLLTKVEKKFMALKDILPNDEMLQDIYNYKNRDKVNFI